MIPSLFRVQSWLRWGLCLCALLVVMSARSASAAPCTRENVLCGLAPWRTHQVDRPELLTDGWQSPNGYPFDVLEAAPMHGIRPFVAWDLGTVRRLKAAAVQADNNDTYRLRVSTDGHHWTEAWRIDRTVAGGLQERTTAHLDVDARFVAVEAVQGDGLYAATEVAVYCSLPQPWPVPSLTRFTSREQPDQTRFVRGLSSKVVLGLLALLALLVVVRRLSSVRARRGVWLALMAACGLAWTDFGALHPDGPVHYSDAFHYYMGTKYFDPVGYFELYRCAAQAERELGRGSEYDTKLIRDLDDNRVYPGTWLRTTEGRCRAQFSQARWESFRKDVDAFHGLMANQATLGATLGDHGFNATPFHTAWLRAWSSWVEVSRTNLALLALLDAAALLIGFGVLAWAFGLETAAATAALFMLGHHWGFFWVGGCFGRHTWLMWALVGLGLLHRERPFWGAVSLTLAGLHRLFPFVFVGALVLFVLVRWAKERRLSAAGSRILAGVFITVALGGAVGAAVNGWHAFPSFARVVERHSTTPSSNQLGLPMILAWSSGKTTASELAEPKLTDPHEIWKATFAQRQRERAPLWWMAIVGGVGLIVWSAYSGFGPWQTVIMAGPLLWGLEDMTSYDYLWLLLLMPLAMGHPRRVTLLIGYGIFTVLVGIYEPDLELAHVYFNAALALMLAFFYGHVVRERLNSVASPENCLEASVGPIQEAGAGKKRRGKKV